MREAVIVDAVRTPFGRRNGSLANIHPVDLSALVLNALIERTGVHPAEVDDVLWGCVGQVGDQASNIGRYACLAAGWPDSVPGVTITRACGSSQQALDFAALGVIAGHYDLVVAGGVESMTRVPLGASQQGGMPYGPTVLDRYDGFSFNQGLSAELIAEKWGFSRADLDTFALGSHQKASNATDNGAFDRQLIPVELSSGQIFRHDECVRGDTTLEAMALLKPSFKKDGLIHAGNSSPISDGASAVLVTTPERADQLGIPPLVRFHRAAVTGSDPVLMLTGPIRATEKLLDRSGVGLEEIGVYEVSEAFAPVPLAWLSETGATPSLLNPLGGAIATGHPLGASGTALMTRMAHHMRDRGIRFGLQTMCEGGGTANATLVELAA